MMGAEQDVTPVRQHRRRAKRLVLGAAVGGFSLLAVGWIGGFRVNLTPSEPLGLWRIIPLDRPAALGDVVFVCPPETPAMREARERGYLRSGLCPAGYAPLIKTVIGVEEQNVEVGAEVWIEGHSVPRSRVSTVDGKGRALARFSRGVIPAGYLFLHSEFIGSFDSRYFGPFPASGVLGLAQEVWTYAP